MWENSACLSRFFETLYTKFAKNSVFWAFCATFRKKCEKTVFFFNVFRDTLYKIRKKAIKQRILSFFARRFAKVWENSVFSHFSRYFVQSLQKNRKTEFIELFAGRSAKNVRKQCFLAFFEHSVQKFAKYCEKQRFWAFRLRFGEKCEKTVFFTFFRDTLY